MNANEKYNFNWLGKEHSIELSFNRSTGTLRPAPNESVNFDTTKNIFIEGDNLEVLKLLQESYHNKIKMIYIDPPYNTGKVFVYSDNFKSNDNNTWQKMSHKRYHTNWLNMIYPRLKLARNLLTDDGVIFISIDDNEQANLKKVCDEIFGEENFVANIIWNNKYTLQNDAKYLSGQYDNILFYAKNKTLFNIGKDKRTDKQNDSYKNHDNDPKGSWKATPIHAKSGTPSNIYTIEFENGILWKSPTGRYPRYTKERLKELYYSNELYFNSNGGVDKKTYLSDVSKKGVVFSDMWFYQDVGHTHGNNEELSNLIGKGIFDNPKGTSLIKRIINVANCKNSDIILDFFAGSCTTAHAVMALNAEDGGNRHFICVQIPEKTDDKSEAFKAGYKTIAEISKERIRRAGKQINTGDIGFKVFKLSHNN